MEDSWLFFLDYLKGCIGSEEDGRHYTFISDKQKVPVVNIFYIAFVVMFNEFNKFFFGFILFHNAGSY